MYTLTSIADIECGDTQVQTVTYYTVVPDWPYRSEVQFLRSTRNCVAITNSSGVFLDWSLLKDVSNTDYIIKETPETYNPPTQPSSDLILPVPASMEYVDDAYKVDCYVTTDGAWPDYYVFEWRAEMGEHGMWFNWDDVISLEIVNGKWVINAFGWVIGEKSIGRTPEGDYGYYKINFTGDFL